MAESLGQERVLYDGYLIAELARPDLDLYLGDLYRNQSDLLIPFFSSEYATKKWCTLEWRQMRDILLNFQGSRIMPFRFDDAPIDGVLSLDGYIKIGTRTPQEIAGLILERLGLSNPYTASKKKYRAFTAKLPTVNTLLIGRANELKFLDDAWGNPTTNFVQIIAPGGTGKTALVDKWFRRHFEEAAIFGWSFYSQGASTHHATSSDTFFSEIMNWLKIDAPPSASVYAKAEAVANRLREERMLLILDGIEPLQDSTGTLQDSALKALLQELSNSNLGLVLCTTRVPMDIPDDPPRGVSLNLENLTPEDGAEYLRQLKVEGEEKELQQASRDCGNHALALTLLGTYLVDFLDGDIRRRVEIRELTPEFLAAKTKAEAISLTRNIATYQSEDWGGPDLLNIRKDVNALAALVAAWNVQPPLSIGLFGEWGSGKSFFMRRMRRRVETLALAAQKSGRPQRECAYYKNIAQIEFNAWHYLEGNNLWACLVQHIFSHLGLPQDTTAEQIENRQKHILEQIGAKKILENQAAERKRELEAKRIEAKRRATNARTELDTKGLALEQEKSALWERVRGQLSAEVEGILQSIPEAAQLRDSVETVRKFSQEAQTLSGRASLSLSLFQHDPQHRKILYWIAGGSAAAFGLVRLTHFAAPNIKLFIQPFFQIAVPLASALAATAARFRTVLKKIGTVVSFFERKNQEITEAIAKAEKVHQHRIAKLEYDVRMLTQSIDQAEGEQREHRSAIRALEEQLASTDANRLLAEFIKSRASADDYRKHLGIVALVRNDFEHLSKLFREQRQLEDEGKERPDSNTVNRIILYIDDLDRCPPETVVNVLQAIHLLLAFPIFVVVVAVDSRWISRSLERCYDWLLAAPAAEVADAINRGSKANTGAVSGATAHDYLEKIFQIPFWLAPMERDTCRFMIRGLALTASREQAKLAQSIARKLEETKPTIEKPDQKAPDISHVPPARGQSGPAPSNQNLRSDLLEAIDSDKEEEVESIDLAPRQLDVAEVELKKIDDLTLLIGRSPRVAKRFLNCYRLIKARLDETELQQFLAGSFSHVMEVLAIIVGAPSMTRTVLDTLSLDISKLERKGFVQQLTTHLDPAALTTTEGAEVLRLLSSADVDHLKSLGGVVPMVSRFSFEVHSQAALTRRSDYFEK